MAPSLLTGPSSIRVFAGYRNATLSREAFLKELGDTFMPGTPYILAPLGLAGYVAAVVDLESSRALPDELALVVYASIDAYQAARERSLHGRMYTHSHAGVFDMVRSRGQFPGTEDEPNKLAGTDRWAWVAFAEARVDWQDGSTRLLFLANGSTAGMQGAILNATRSAKRSLHEAGVDQVVVLASTDYAAIWLHSVEPIEPSLDTFGLVPNGIRVERDLVATPIAIRNGDERVAITGPSAFAFRFVRDLRHFL
jgi:hypothetical protein